MPEPAVVEKPKEEVKPESLITEPVKKEEPKPVEAAKPVEKIVYDLKVPEGSKLTKADVERATAQAEKLGLSKEQGQALLNERADAVKSYEASELQKIKDDAPKWLEQLKTEFGDKFGENVENAKRVVGKYADQDFKDFLNTTGLGNHPMIVKMFSKLGKAFGEDHWKDGQPIVNKKELSPAEKLYDKTPKN